LSSQLEHEAVVTELNPGSTYAVTNMVALDGRVSWAIPWESGFIPSNVYVLRSDDGTLIVDTGLACDAASVIGALRRIVPNGGDVSIALTRTEPDCIGNLEAILGGWSVSELVSASALNPLDYAGLAASQFGDLAARQVRFGNVLQVGGSERLHVIEPAVRELSTSWLFDAADQILFTSDVFGHAYVSAFDERAVVTGDDNHRFSAEHVRSHMLAKFDWLTAARTTRMLEKLDEIWDTYQPTTIAPRHGCIIQGKSATDHHYALVRAVIEGNG
jgi:flavorubredoxin